MQHFWISVNIGSTFISTLIIEGKKPRWCKYYYIFSGISWCIVPMERS